ncbi:MAG: DUF6291 domain-containing protein, partial [Clostridiales bacterium]|nr:DUF6291 domain-containing protein [Clostridiales bacterium]
MKESFVVRNEIEKQTAMLSDEQMGQLFRAMLQFNRGAEPALSDPLVSLAFSFVRDSMERDRAKYEATCEKRKTAGARGGRPQKQKKQMVSAETDFFNPESKRFSENPDSVPVPEPEPEPVPDSVPVPVTQSMGVSGGTQTETGTPDGENTRDFLDSVAYFDKCGLSLSRGNRRILARWVREVGFDVVVLAVDRAM